MNIFKLSHAFLAVIMIASCNKMITTVTLEGVGYITVTSQIGSQTKAGYETKNLPSEFVMDIDQNGTDHDYALLNMSRNGSSNTYIANKNDIAWASTDRRDVSVKAMTMPAGVTEINSNGIVSINLLSNQTTLENFNKNDILGAKKADNGGITIKGDNINISFQHLMSKLHVIYETANPSTKVNAITLKNVCLGGAYSYEDINYFSSLEERGNINMYINTAAPDYSIYAAEAIFFPFEGMPTLEVTTNLGVKTCDLVNQNFKFERGKRYVLKITIDANGNVTKTNISTENNWVKNVPGGKILWIGTSIPAGGGTVFSYPQMVANATGLEVVNNAVGGSLVLKVKDGAADLQVYTVKGSEDQTGWTEVPVGNGTFRKDEDGNYVPDTEKGNFNPYLISAWDKVGAVNHLKYGGLWQTRDQVETTYRTALQSISNNDNEWVEKWINEMKNLSYESLIIPYVDGTIDNCNTIIIDHGFNDLARMVAEAGGFKEFVPDPIATDWGTNYLNKLISGDITYEQHCTHIQTMDESSVFGTFKEYSYIIAMHDIISAIKNANPNARIIIGNYFAYDSPYVNTNTFGNAWDAYQFTKLILYYNKAVASIWDLDIVNVYEDPTVSTMVTTDFMGFCPDGVHPSSDYTGKSNKAIADVYLQELAKIFVSTKTQSSTYAYDYGWEDVEML